MKQAHEAYLAVAQAYLDKAQNTLDQVAPLNMLQTSAKAEIESFMRHAERQIDQTRRRVIDGEVIPHAEKVFSVFETHTEWISKGKAGVPVELGKRCCVLEDQHRFILHHLVMDKQTDDQVAVPIIKEATSRFPCLRLCSFDKGFHSPANQTTLANALETVVLPRKGKRSQAAQAIEAAKDFVKARRQHSAVESDKLGHGGQQYIAALFGVDCKTIRQGLADLELTEDAAGEKCRKKAAGGSASST